MSELHDGDVVKATVIEAYMAKSRSKGTPSLHLVLDCLGEEIQSDIWITPAVMWKARKQMKALGIDIDRVTLAQVEAGRDRLKGREVEVTIECEDFRGNMQVKAEINFGGPTKPEESELDALTKSLRAAASDESRSKAAAKDAKPSAPPPPQRTREETKRAVEKDVFDGEGEIPFSWFIPLLTSALALGAMVA